MNASESVIEFTYGKNADLYEDVLKIESDAKPNDIKAAFFDRRAELYEEISSKDKDALTPSERHFCEKKMDAIVLAFRILHNRETRRRYDNMLRKGLNKTDSSEFSKRMNETNGNSNNSFTTNSQQENGRASVVTPEKRFSDQFTKFQDDNGTDISRVTSGPEGNAAVLSTSFQPNFSPSSERSTTPDQRNRSIRSTSSHDHDDRSVQSDANISVNSDVLMSREREKAKSMSCWDEDDDEDDDTASYLSEHTDETYETYDSDTTQATANTAGSNAGSSYNTYDTNDDTASYEEIGNIPLKESKKKAKKSRHDHSLNNTMDIIDSEDTGCFALSQKEKKKLKHDIIKGKNCFELISGENGLPNPTRMFHVISDEVSGSITDTVKAIDQVFTAFNLNEYDIDAVGDNIGDATDNLCHS